MTIPAWIITLNPEGENTRKLVADLHAQGMEANLFAAVDGRQQTPPLEHDEKISPTKSLINRRALLTNSEIGCYLSHYRLIKQAYARGDSHVLIMEDDIAIEPHLKAVVDEIVQLPENFHLVRLMSLKIRKRKVIKNLFPPYQIVRPTRGALGTQAYVVNRAGMEKILSFGAEMCMAIDKLYDSFFLYGLHCYCLEPHCVEELVHESSIKKARTQLDERLWIKAVWHANKLYRSIWRRIDFFKNFSEYQGAVKSSTKPGKSARLRH